MTDKRFIFRCECGNHFSKKLYLSFDKNRWETIDHNPISELVCPKCWDKFRPKPPESNQSSFFDDDWEQEEKRWRENRRKYHEEIGRILSELKIKISCVEEENPETRKLLPIKAVRINKAAKFLMDMVLSEDRTEETLDKQYELPSKSLSNLPKFVLWLERVGLIEIFIIGGSYKVYTSVDSAGGFFVKASKSEVVSTLKEIKDNYNKGENEKNKALLQGIEKFF